MLPSNLPEVQFERLDHQAEELHDREQEALLALGRARLMGLPGDAARFELRRVRDELEAEMAARRVLEIMERSR